MHEIFFSVESFNLICHTAYFAFIKRWLECLELDQIFNIENMGFILNMFLKYTFKNMFLFMSHW